MVKTKHGFSIKVAEKQKLLDCVFLLFFLKQKFLVFFLVFSSFFFLTVRPHQLALSANLVFLFFLQFEAKKNNNSCFFFFSCLPYVEVRNFIFLFDFFFFSTQHKLLTEFPHQELFFLSFCSIRFPGPQSQLISFFRCTNWCTLKLQVKQQKFLFLFFLLSSVSLRFFFSEITFLKGKDDQKLRSKNKNSKEVEK